MKKFIVLLIIVLGLSLIANAAVLKLDFYEFVNNSVDGELAEGCFAIVNYDPEGNTEAVIQIQVRGLEAGEYELRSKKEILGSFTTNKKGSGHLHVNVEGSAFEEVVNGRRLNIYKDGDRLLWTGFEEF